MEAWKQARGLTWHNYPVERSSTATTCSPNVSKIPTTVETDEAGTTRSFQRWKQGLYLLPEEAWNLILGAHSQGLVSRLHSDSLSCCGLGHPYQRFLGRAHTLGREQRLRPLGLLVRTLGKSFEPSDTAQEPRPTSPKQIAGCGLQSTILSLLPFLWAGTCMSESAGSSPPLARVCSRLSGIPLQLLSQVTSVDRQLAASIQSDPPFLRRRSSRETTRPLRAPIVYQAVVRNR